MHSIDKLQKKKKKNRWSWPLDLLTLPERRGLLTMSFSLEVDCAIQFSILVASHQCFVYFNPGNSSSTVACKQKQLFLYVCLFMHQYDIQPAWQHMVIITAYMHFLVDSLVIVRVWHQAIATRCIILNCSCIQSCVSVICLRLCTDSKSSQDPARFLLPDQQPRTVASGHETVSHQ